MMSNNDVCAGCGRRLGIVQHARDGKWFCLECIDNPPKVIQRSELSSKEKTSGGRGCGSAVSGYDQ